jgi:hypothetical protein
MVALDKSTSRGRHLISPGEIDAFCRSRKLQLIKLIGVYERTVVSDPQWSSFFFAVLGSVTQA